jgi:DNA-binding response OmpR family regulator
MSRDTTILIIDDDAELRQALVEQFELEPGYAGEGAATAAEGFDAAANLKPAAIVLDVSLPDMDGFDA